METIESLKAENDRLKAELDNIHRSWSLMKAELDGLKTKKPIARGYRNSMTGTCSELYWLLEPPEGETNLYAAPIPAHQSPAVAVPDDVRMNAKLYDDNDVQVILTECSEAIGCAPLTNLWQISRMISSPRITEQDARDIALSFYWFVVDFKHKLEKTPSIIEWNEAEGRALLAKLNEIRKPK